MSDQIFTRSVSNTNRTPSGRRVIRDADTPVARPDALPQRPVALARAAKMAGRFRRTSRGAAPSRPHSPVGDAWNLLPFVAPSVRRNFLSGAPLLNFIRPDPAARAVDQLRTQLLHKLRSKSWRRVAIASPTGGCGATFTAVNLAQSLARVPGSRTVLMDINHRSPGIAETLEMESAGDMRAFLQGETAIESHLVRASKTLALGLATKCEAGAAEVLHDARCGDALTRMEQALRPDVILYDLPPMLIFDDLAAILPHVDAVLLVADATTTTASEITACERVLEGQAHFLGTILNRARMSEAV